jgi:hypothetical protein
MNTTNGPVILPRDKIDTTALALFGAMFLGLALVGGSSLWEPVTNAFQSVTQNFGTGNMSAIEVEQRRQAEDIKKLGRGLIKVALGQDAASLGGGNVAAFEAEQRRQAEDIKKLGRGIIKVGLEQDTVAKLVDHSDTAVNDRFGRIEAEVSALESKVKAGVAGNPDASLSHAIGQLGIAQAHARTDIYGLRSSLDEHAQTVRKEIAAITTRLDAVEQASQSHRVDALAARLDQLEQLVARDLTSSIAPPARKKIVKRKPRAIKAAPAESQPAYPQIAYPQYPFQPAMGAAAMQ